MSIEASQMFLLLAATHPWAWGAVLGALAVGLLAIWNDKAARMPSQAMRVPVPTDAAPIWIGLGVMVLFYIYTPMVFGALFSDGRPVTTQPTTMPINLEHAIETNLATYLCSILAGVAIHAYMHSPAKRFLGLAKPTVKQLRLVLSASLVAIPLTYLVSALTQTTLDFFSFQHPTSHPMLYWMSQLSDRPGLRLAAIVSATLLAPLFEEIFFRGHLQTALVGMLPNRWTGILITSFLFASLHPWWTVPAIFALSVCLGVLYERTNSLWMPIAMHIAFNATSTAVFLLQR
jgi:membrane protease YdiL (CAAX protease family)